MGGGWPGSLIATIRIHQTGIAHSFHMLTAIPGEHCLWVKEKELYGKQGQNLIE